MRIRIVEKLWQIFFDSLGVLAAFIGAYFFRLGTFFHGEFLFLPYITMALFLIPFWLFLLAFAGRYSIREKSIWEEFRIIFITALSASLLFPLLFYFTNERFFSRGIIILLFALSVVLLTCITLLQRYFIQKKVEKNVGIFRMLIIGTDQNSQRVIESLLKTVSYHKPVALLSPYGTKKKSICGIKVFGKLDSLERVFESEKIDEIFLCEGIEHSENLASFCRNKGIRLKTSLDTMGISHHQILAENISGNTFLTLHQSPLFGWGQFFKRGFDFTIAISILFFFFPYILWNRRYIQNIQYQNGLNSSFSAYVFEKNGEQFGEKLGLLLSVVQKKASLIGPKVFTSAEYEHRFSEKKEQTAMRFILRPGIFAPEKKSEDIFENFREEVRYIQNWSFWNDLKIFFRQFY